MRYNIVTPLKRTENVSALVNCFSKVTNLYWHVLLDQGESWHVSKPWIKTHYYPLQSPFWKAWARHLNSFIKHARILVDERYLILNDDDLVEPDFFRKLDSHHGEVLICSMLRGHHRAGHGHDITTLAAEAKNMNPGSVGCEQLICSGKIFRTLHFEDAIDADGKAIAALTKHHAVSFVPDAFVWFNALEPGRWDQLPA